MRLDSIANDIPRSKGTPPIGGLPSNVMLRRIAQLSEDAAFQRPQFPLDQNPGCHARLTPELRFGGLSGRSEGGGSERPG